MICLMLQLDIFDVDRLHEMLCGDPTCVASSPVWIIAVGHRLFKASNRKCLDTMAIQCTTQALLARPRVLSHHNTLQYAGSLILQDHAQTTSHQPISMHTAALDSYSDKHSP